MNPLVRQRIDRLTRKGSANVLAGGRKGVEKESLRVRPDGMLAETMGGTLGYERVDGVSVFEFTLPAETPGEQAPEVADDAA